MTWSLQRLGAAHLSFGPPLGPDPLSAVRMLGQRVMPQLGTRRPTSPAGYSVVNEDAVIDGGVKEDAQP